MTFRIVIPARTISTRLPKKLLRLVGGRSILEHTWRQARRSSAEQVVIAADSDEIADLARRFGAQVVLTDPELPSGTLRVRQAASTLRWSDEQLILNVQGDEPATEPSLIDALAEFAQSRRDSAIATVSNLERDESVYRKYENVKVVCDARDRALYFSRQPIPWGAKTHGLAIHIGIYAYRLSYLHRYAAYPPCPLERQERLEQLKALWQGDTIAVLSRTGIEHHGIDTETDLEKFNHYWITRRGNRQNGD